MEYTRALPIKFWQDAEKRVGKCPDIDIAVKSICEADIKESVRHAFRDLTVRTMHKRNKYKNGSLSLDKLAKECCDAKNGLYSMLDNWFLKETTKSFDQWHKDACDAVKIFLGQYYVSADCTCGKAQKIVNMSIKNLYALCVVKGIEDKYELRFQYCHVPLDSFTLEWFCRECIKRKQVLTKGNVLNWSAIDAYGDDKTDTYDKDGKNYYTYYYFQKTFRNWYSGKPTPLQQEFVFWPQIQLEIAAENFLFALEEDIALEEKQKIRSNSLEEKLNQIRRHLHCSTKYR